MAIKFLCSTRFFVPKPHFLLHLFCLHHLNVHDSHTLGLFHLILFLAIWGLLNSLSWSNLSLRERAFLCGKAQSIIVSSYQEVSYSRLFEYQWFVVNHLFIRLLSESDLRWMSVGIRKSILWILPVLYRYNSGRLYRSLYIPVPVPVPVPVLASTANTTSTTGVYYTATEIFCSKWLIYFLQVWQVRGIHRFSQID